MSKNRENGSSRFVRGLRLTGKAIWVTFKWTFVVLLLAGFLGGGAVYGYVSAVLKDEPVRSHDEIMKKMSEDAITGYVYFSDDSVIGQLRTEEDRQIASFSDIPLKMQEAVLAIEDKDFMTHHGVDLSGSLRAVKQQVLNESVQTGGSTITQQLARRVFLNLDRDITRKIKEMVLALRLERHMSKDEILTAYLNKVPYGNGSNGYNLYGIKTAAKGIFNVNDLHKLNIAQFAYLAGIPQQPNNFSNYNSKGKPNEERIKDAIDRQKLVLGKMLENQYITDAEYKEALAFDIRKSLAPTKEKAYNTYPFLMIEAEKKAMDILVSIHHPDIDKETNPDLYSEALKEEEINLQRGGYKVYTTINKQIYDSMQVIGKNDENFTPYDKEKGYEQVGAVLLNNKNGAILGMIEGRGYDREQYNHAMQAERQPGSTMKPIAAYLPALEKGAIQPAGVIDDIPVILKDYQKGFHIPENWDHKFHGLVTARVALNQSYNIPAIKLFLNDVGIQEAWNFAKELGINSLTDSDYSAQTGVIGGLAHGVTVEEMTNAYSSIPNGGEFLDAYMIRKIVDAEGNTIYEHTVEPKRVYSEQTAYLMTDMLRTVITDGTAKSIKTLFKHYGEVATSGKTGSTQDDGDAWYMGYTPDITLGVWVGYDDQKYKLSKKTGGTERAKQIWALVMDEVMNKKPDLFPNKTFTQPKGLTKMTVSTLSGKIPNEEVVKAGKLTTDLFNVKYIPQDEDDVLVPIKTIVYNGVNYVAKPETPEEFLTEKLGIKRKESISALLKRISELMAKVSAKDRKPIERYIPVDADMDAPQEVDPRTDDGQNPAPPTGLAMTGGIASAKITFTPSTSTDVVGYRIYRAADMTSYQQITGNVVLAGAPAVFTVTAPGALSAYYVTAVDVVGKESEPSTVVLPGGSTIPDPGDTVTPTPGPGESTNPDSSATPQPAQVPTAPSGITAVREAAGIHLTWTANPSEQNITEYRLYYAATPEGPFEWKANTRQTEILYITGLGSGSFYLTAVNENGESDPSVITTVQ
ncbi:transglycosylase domain-containing protein [Gorillibacterium timonense]|uniref:transglycosylase domain-containing protein n=1 Tax=Gorillibacterium timonense TaxID=1689269 RepID=UPI00071D77AB|nr:transglycosylase domain-containing protein [Gorillibacterium timonense]